MDPTNGTALASASSALAVLGDKERAREWMRRALLLDPDNLVMRYNAACALLRKLGEPEEALDTLEPFFKGVTSNTWIWHAEADPDFARSGTNRASRNAAAAKKRLGMTTASCAERVGRTDTPV
jgi:adenylate cyclase